MHEHDHPHETLLDSDGPASYSERLEAAVRELRIERGLFSADDVRRKVEELDSCTPALGSRVVAHAWVDPAYKARLLANGTAAVEELRIPMRGVNLVVVE